MNKRILFILLVGLTFLPIVSNADGLLRYMRVYEVKALGLEVWTEKYPNWDIELEHINGQPIFIAESPRNYYPPSVMTVTTFKKLNVDKNELKEVAQSAFEQSAKNFGVSGKEISKLKIQAQEFKHLKGYETTFDGVANGENVTVRVFIGRQEGKPVVSMMAYTYRGKISHIKEQLRRTWDNVSYLK